MPFFRPKERRADDTEVSRQYLSGAPRLLGRPLPRTDNLAIGCIQRVSAEGPGDKHSLGEPLTALEMAPLNALVREVMRQDCDLSAWVARKAVIIMRTVIDVGMAGPVNRRLDEVFGAVGLRVQQDVTMVDDASELVSAAGRDEAIAYGAATLALLKVAGASSKSWEPADRSFYENLYTGADGSDVASLAYDLIAWSAIVLSRLNECGKIGSMAFDYFDPSLAAVPQLTREAWYPNPAKFGDTSTGDAEFQRFWDGENWTPRVRVRQGRSWTEREMSLHATPCD
jgi:hypothetical protein